MNHRPTISILCLSFEAHSRHQVTASVYKNLQAMDWSNILELMFVDNGSTDGTKELLQGWCRELPQLKLTALEKTLPSGAALMQAARKLYGTVCVVIDIDQLSSLSSIEDFLPARIDCDVVHGVRRNRPFGLRLLASRAFGLYYRFVLGGKLQDVGNNFYVLRRSALEMIVQEAERTRVTFLPLIIERLERLGKLCCSNRAMAWQEAGQSSQTWRKLFRLARSIRRESGLLEA